jgi:PAS domain S-box-containing protein
VGTARPFRDLPLKWTDTSFQSLLDVLPDAVLVVNHAAEIAIANKHTEKIFGYSREELIG